MNYIGTLRQPRNLSTRAHIRHEVKAWINLVAKSEGSMLGLKNEECQRTFFVWTFYVAPWNHSTASESSCNALLIQCNKTHLGMEIASIDSIAVGKNEAQLGGCLLIPSPPPSQHSGPPYAQRSFKVLGLSVMAKQSRALCNSNLQKLAGSQVHLKSQDYLKT